MSLKYKHGYSTLLYWNPDADFVFFDSDFWGPEKILFDWSNHPTEQSLLRNVAVYSIWHGSFLWDYLNTQPQSQVIEHLKLVRQFVVVDHLVAGV